MICHRDLPTDGMEVDPVAIKKTALLVDHELVRPGARSCSAPRPPRETIARGHARGDPRCRAGPGTSSGSRRRDAGARWRRRTSLTPAPSRPAARGTTWPPGSCPHCCVAGQVRRRCRHRRPGDPRSAFAGGERRRTCRGRATRCSARVPVDDGVDRAARRCRGCVGRRVAGSVTLLDGGGRASRRASCSCTTRTPTTRSPA